jgi:hypothetical protein
MTSGDSRDVERNTLAFFWDEVLGELGWSDEESADPDTDPTIWACKEIRRMKNKISTLHTETQIFRNLLYQVKKDISMWKTILDDYLNRK